MENKNLPSWKTPLMSPQEEMGIAFLMMINKEPDREEIIKRYSKEEILKVSKSWFNPEGDDEYAKNMKMNMDYIISQQYFAMGLYGKVKIPDKYNKLMVELDYLSGWYR